MNTFPILDAVARGTITRRLNTHIGIRWDAHDGDQPLPIQDLLALSTLTALGWIEWVSTGFRVYGMETARLTPLGRGDHPESQPLHDLLTAIRDEPWCDDCPHDNPPPVSDRPLAGRSAAELNADARRLIDGVFNRNPGPGDVA